MTWPRPGLHPDCPECGEKWFRGHSAECRSRPSSGTTYSLPRAARDNGADRELGAKWVKRFGRWCDRYGLANRSIPQVDGAPDREVEERHAHEVKHKTPTGLRYLLPGEPYPRRYVGLETYRLELFAAYERRTGLEVFYTIHDWGIVGDRLSELDELDAWRTGSLRFLLEEGVPAEVGKTYFRGEMTDQPVDGVFFPWGAFRPLAEYLDSLSEGE